MLPLSETMTRELSTRGSTDLPGSMSANDKITVPTIGYLSDQTGTVSVGASKTQRHKRHSEKKSDQSLLRLAD